MSSWRGFISKDSLLWLEPRKVKGIRSSNPFAETLREPRRFPGPIWTAPTPYIPSRSSGGASFAERLCLRLTPASAPESCGCSGLAEPLHGACLGHPETLLLHSCRLPGSCTRPSEVTGLRYSWKPCLELDPYRRYFLAFSLSARIGCVSVLGHQIHRAAGSGGCLSGPKSSLVIVSSSSAP